MRQVKVTTVITQKTTVVTSIPDNISLRDLEEMIASQGETHEYFMTHTEECGSRDVDIEVQNVAEGIEFNDLFPHDEFRREVTQLHRDGNA